MHGSTNIKRVILLVFRFHLRSPKLSFYVPKFYCTSYQSNSAEDKSGPTRDIMVPRQPPDPFACAPTLWWRCGLHGRLVFEISNKIFIINSVKIVPRATVRTCLPQFTSQLSHGPYAVPRYTPVTNVAAYTIRTFSMKMWISFTVLSRNLGVRKIPLDLLFRAMQNALYNWEGFVQNGSDGDGCREKPGEYVVHAASVTEGNIFTLFGGIGCSIGLVGRLKT